jgi:nitrite reductase (NADH) small subunit
MDAWTPLIEVARVPAGRGAVVEWAGGALAVFVVEGVAHVLENRCPHREGDLGEGYVANGCVYCPLHAWPFELCSGRSPTHPGAEVRVYPARIEGGVVQAQLDSLQLAERGTP